MYIYFLYIYSIYIYISVSLRVGGKCPPLCWKECLTGSTSSSLTLQREEGSKNTVFNVCRWGGQVLKNTGFGICLKVRGDQDPNCMHGERTHRCTSNFLASAAIGGQGQQKTHNMLKYIKGYIADFPDSV